MNKLPAKIQNLFYLKEIGLNVPVFFVLDEEKIKKITESVQELKSYFNKRKIENIIIRSASFSEDGSGLSMAGVFDSSSKTNIEDLNEDLLEEYWKRNLKKAGPNRLFMFVQEFFEADYYGVLFTEDVYDRDGAVLNLSREAEAVTDGKNIDIQLRYQKKENVWQGEGVSGEVLEEAKEIIKKVSIRYTSGADIEIGIKNAELRVFQIRPITRSVNDKILLEEKKRLQEKYGEYFLEQEWERNSFAQALGRLDDESLDFYNNLLNSQELNELLLEAKIISKKKSKKDFFEVLEKIGGNIFYNNTQDKKLFVKKEGRVAEFSRLVMMLSGEKLMKKVLAKINVEEMNTEEVFSWFFLSGIYYNHFLSQDKRRFKKDFFDRLKSSELRCEATEPRPGSDLEKFQREYYYLASNPYNLSDKSIAQIRPEKVSERYKYLSDKNIEEPGEGLSGNTEFWLGKRVEFKELFLKKIFNLRNTEHRGETKDSLALVSEKISAKNFPFSYNVEGGERVIVAGEMNEKDIVKLSGEENIEDYLGKVIEIDSFPGRWIPYIPKIGGLVLKEGNELSHMAITCREYGVPCKVKQSWP